MKSKTYLKAEHVGYLQISHQNYIMALVRHDKREMINKWQDVNPAQPLQYNVTLPTYLNTSPMGEASQRLQDGLSLLHRFIECRVKVEMHKAVF